jgi:thioredoxin-like negative regulator of GroEL
LILFRQGRELDRVSGALPASQLDDFIARHLK